MGRDAGPQPDHHGYPRLFPGRRLRADGRAHPDRQRRRGDVDAVRARVLRRARLPHAVRPTARRGDGDGDGQDLYVRTDVPGREIQDPAAPDGVLDDRARDGVLRPGDEHGGGRRAAVPHRPRRRGGLPPRARDPRPRRRPPRSLGRSSVPAPDLLRGRRAPHGRRDADPPRRGDRRP